MGGFQRFGTNFQEHFHRTSSSAARSSWRARWMYVFTVPRGSFTISAISSYERSSTCLSMMQARYSGLSWAIARSIELPSSRDSSSASGDSSPDATIDGCRPGALGCHRVRRALDADRVEPTAAQVIDRDVVRDLEQPAREFELGPVAIDVVEDLDERFLRQVLGRLPVAHHAENQRKYGPLIPREQLAVGGFLFPVARARRPRVG